MITDNENRCFCATCGAPLGDGPFCGNCGAGAPVPAAPETNAAPVVLTEARPRRFPVASVILVGVAALWMLIQLFANPGSTVFTALYAGCTVAILLGMILCKNKRDWITGITFVSYACIVLVSTILSVINYHRASVDILTTALAQVFNVTNLLCYTAFGISYLVAKPKLFVLKIVTGAVLVGSALFGCLCVAVAFFVATEPAMLVWGLLTFPLYAIPLGVGTILYTPFRKG